MASGLAERRLPKPPEAMPGLKGWDALGHCAGRMPQVAERRADPGVPVDDNGLGRLCLVKPDFRFGTAVGILDQIRPMPPSPNPCDTAWGSCNPGRPLS